MAAAFQADDEGSIPFTRSTPFDGSCSFVAEATEPCGAHRASREQGARDWVGRANERAVAGGRTQILKNRNPALMARYPTRRRDRVLS